jgi:hypothetical protein
MRDREIPKLGKKKVSNLGQGRGSDKQIGDHGQEDGNRAHLTIGLIHCRKIMRKKKKICTGRKYVNQKQGK